MDWKGINEESYRDRNRFYLVVAGDKSFKPNNFTSVCVNGQVEVLEVKDFVCAWIDYFLTKSLQRGWGIKVVTGDNNGVDKIAITYAEEHDYDAYTFQANWDDIGKRAGYERNEDMFFFVGRRPHKGAILFWDGEDPYTLNLIYQAKLFSTPCRVYNYNLKRWLSKDEVTVIQSSEHKKREKYH